MAISVKSVYRKHIILQVIVELLQLGTISHYIAPALSIIILDLDDLKYKKTRNIKKNLEVWRSYIMQILNYGEPIVWRSKWMSVCSLHSTVIITLSAYTWTHTGFDWSANVSLKYGALNFFCDRSWYTISICPFLFPFIAFHSSLSFYSLCLDIFLEHVTCIMRSDHQI